MSVYLNEYEVVTVLRDAKMCSTSERYSKNIGAQRSPIDRAFRVSNLPLYVMSRRLMYGIKCQIN